MLSAHVGLPCTLGTFAWPPIDMSGGNLVHVFAKSTSKVSEAYLTHFCRKGEKKFRRLGEEKFQETMRIKQCQ